MKGEFDLIETYFAPLAATVPGSLALKDDAAVLPVGEGMELVVTTDCLVSGVHFLPGDPPDTVARKLLAVNVSDLASMGAAPRYYTLAAALPKDTDDAWFASFASGLKAGLEHFGGGLVGGDTVSMDGPLTLTLTALGETPKGSALKRSGAQPGDTLFVTGTIGDAHLGLHILQGLLAEADENRREFLVQRYRTPTPRSDLGIALRGIASAAIDISDGLAADLTHLCEVSGVGAVVDSALVPLSSAARYFLAGKMATYQELFSGGDDYELLFTVPKQKIGLLNDLRAAVDCPFTKIGQVTGGPEIRFKDGNTVLNFDKTGYRHF